MAIKTSNEEWVTPRDIAREWGRHLQRLADGEVEKLVIVKGTEMKAVVLPIEEYERLLGGEPGEV